MPDLSVVLITGAAGNMGRKLREHWTGRVHLKLLDRDPRGDRAVCRADLCRWDTWHEQFAGVDTVVHFAADPEAYKGWDELIAPNIDAVIHAYRAAAEHRVRRFIFASSNHVMGGYQDQPEVRLSSTTPPRPGLRYSMDGQRCDSTAYAAAKLFGERLGQTYGQSVGMETIAIRVGWILRDGPNQPQRLPSDRGEWFRLMWLSDRDFLNLMDGCLAARLPRPFVIANGMSNNTGMPWDLAETCELLNYEPQDDVTLATQPWRASSEGWYTGNGSNGGV